MGYLLFIDCCVRPNEVSRTHRLASAFLEEYRLANPVAEVRIKKLTELNLSPHSWATLQIRDKLLKETKLDDSRFELAHEFAGADKIVIAAPFWDLSFPALLKIYIENVSVGGVTFGFDGNRMFGKCKCEKLLYITTRGGNFSVIDADMEMAMPQLRALSQMFGLGEVSLVCAEGIDIEGCDYDGLLNVAEESARREGRRF